MSDDIGESPDGDAQMPRGPKGHFLKGCKPGPGKPRNSWIARRQRLIEGEITDEECKALVRQTFQDAMCSIDAAALIGSRKLLWPYLFGSAPRGDEEADDEDAERVGRIILNIVKR